MKYTSANRGPWTADERKALAESLKRFADSILSAVEVEGSAIAEWSAEVVERPSDSGFLEYRPTGRIIAAVHFDMRLTKPRDTP